MSERSTEHGVRREAGFTLVELVIAAALLSVIVVKVTMVIGSASESHGRETSSMALEDQAHRVLDQIAYAVMGAKRDELVPDPESPNYSTEVRYTVSLGVVDGEVVQKDPERIGPGNGLSQLVWQENPDEPDERQVVWTNIVAPYFEGEIPNGVDDNGNGLIDESGASFTVAGDSVTIRLTLARQQSDGTLVQESVETLVTCRN